jgi:hypothetical protein
LEVKQFRGKVGEDVKRVSRYSIREIGDDSNAVLGIGCFIGGCVNGWGSVRKSRGRVRMYSNNTPQTSVRT